MSHSFESKDGQGGSIVDFARILIGVSIDRCESGNVKCVKSLLCSIRSKGPMDRLRQTTAVEDILYLYFTAVELVQEPAMWTTCARHSVTN